MLLRIAFLVIFFGGLAIAVHSMLHGAELWKRKRSPKASPVLNPPTVAALALGFGVCGYLLVTRTGLRPLPIILISAATAAAAVSGAIVLMAKWALRDSAAGSHHEDEEIHGQVATVTRAISPDSDGEITYFAWDRKHVLPARSVDGSAIAEGTEVVIDVMRDGVASVELWSVVETRL